MFGASGLETASFGLEMMKAPKPGIMSIMLKEI